MRKIYGFGAERIESPRDISRADLIKRNRMMLARALNLRTTVAFIGAGCSVPLGYPVWKDFTRDVVRRTVAAVASHSTPSQPHPMLRRLQSIEKRLASPRKIPTRDLLFFIGVCQTASEDLPRRDRDCYRQAIVEQFIPPRTPRRQKDNPYDALLELPIFRFVTSNYDVELERALSEIRKVPWCEFGLDENKPPTARPKSFTQKPEFHDQAAIFAVAELSQTRNFVFHCHGRYDDPSSIVATERDYQEWYLADRPDVAPFRQSIELLFGSNPILFVGFGMEDEDLLRPLRMFHAAGAERRHARPLFALLPVGSAHDSDWHDQLFERYGVHVIPYRKPSQAAMRARKNAWAATLCRELRDLDAEWKDDMAEWFRKPAIRKVEVTAHAPALYRHYAPMSGDTDVLAPKRMQKDVVELEEEVDRHGVVVITGEGGAGKSWRVLRMLEAVHAKNKFDGYFFWSSYYTDDWLTGLDRALRYLEKKRSATPRKRRLDRFVDLVGKGSYLLVFDGFERLLRQTEPGIGTPTNRGISRLLQAAVRSRTSTIVLTTRLMPDVLAEERIKPFGVRKLTTQDLAEGGIFADILGKDFTLADLSALCSLCEGHSYALLLASTFLRRGPVGRRMADLRHELARVSPNHRISHVIDLIVRAVDKDTKGAARALLERLAIFMSPVTGATLDICYEAVQASVRKAPSLARTLKALSDAHLVFAVSTEPRGSAPLAHTVHPTVRGYVFERLHRAGGEMLPNFSLVGFTSGNVPVWPGSKESAEQIVDLFDRLEAAAERAPDRRLARELCRSAFGVLRSRLEANTASRWCGYTNYVKFGIRAAMLVKSLSPALWDFAERTHASTLEHPQGVLYADELAWLYSDTGLALFSEGSMADTYSVWELSYEIDRVTDNEDESGQYVVQSRLHMAGVFIEQGKLRDADMYLNQCENANRKYGDRDYDGRVAGYRALLRHLRGDLTAADELYACAMEIFDRGIRNLRAESIFLQHWSDLKIALRQYDEARRLVNSSLAAAREGRSDDLVAYARCTLGHLERAEGNFTAAQIEYKAALDAAHTQQIRRLESDVYSEMSRLALTLGDWETARARAIASLMIANELSLGLRRSHGLVVLGLAAANAGQTALGGAYLRHAHSVASEQTYHLRSQEAERELRKRGLPPP